MQSLGLGTSSDKPIQVYADNGIEWDQNTHRYIARGNAKAIQGTTTVYGDTLIAYYEEMKGGSTEVYRLDALGHVRILSPTETAYGQKAVYDVRNGVLVMTGNNLKFVSQSEIITARDSLEYYENKSLAVARGNAVSKPVKKPGAPPSSNDRTVRGDVLTAHFEDNDKAGASKAGTGTKPKPKKKAAKDGASGSGNSIDRLDAYGHVVVTRPGEVAIGTRGVYFPKTDIANLWGQVKITRADNQLNGEFAEVNFKTGISRLLSGRKAPVQALIVPKEKPKNPQPGN